MTSNLLRLGLSSQPMHCFGFNSNSYVGSFGFKFNPYLPRRRSIIHRKRHHCLDFTVSSSIQVQTEARNAASKEEQSGESTVLLDVSGMMCGGCVSRVKSVLSSDGRVDSVAVNMLTETAAIKLKPEFVDENVAESLARILTECGFEAKRRVSGQGVVENVRKWKEMLKKKEELLVKSRNRIAFAWTLVALCCGSHASHILHSFGIHAAHG